MESYLKTCTRCKRILSSENFYAMTGTKDGKTTVCKECLREYQKHRYSLKDKPKRIKSIGPKVCSKLDCDLAGIVQPMENFSKHPKASDGLSSACKACTQKVNKKWQKDNKEQINKRRAKKRLENIEKCREYDSNYNKNNWPTSKLRQIKHRSSKAGIPFNLEKSDLSEMPEFCPVLYIRLDYNKGEDRRMWASVDRIKPPLGYVKGNIRIISMAANSAKMDGEGDIIPPFTPDAPDAEWFFKFL